MPRNQSLDARPWTCQEDVKVPPTQVSKPQMDDPRGWGVDEDPVGEIGVLGHDHQIVFSGELLEIRIPGTPVKGA